MEYGDEVVEKQLCECSAWLGDVGRVRTRGQGHTPPVTLRKIGGGHCEELVLRKKHSGHVVAEDHLTVVRAMGREWQSADGCGYVQVQCRVESVEIHSVRRAEAALTWSEDETVAKEFSL